ncbi:MAG TPA: threonine--tRNA ligase [Clostridiales bacterium]|jgi:threonyl-tRNA synthetase|nr:threonine--tRNA ligase [Clostridiales bacterium]
MIKINLSGKEMQAPKGANVLDLMEDPQQKKTALAAKVNGKVQELMAPIEEDATVELLFGDSPEGLHVLRHSASHVLAEAVKRLYPEAKLAIGPAIENGFYYDIDYKESFTPEDLEKIEKEMKSIIRRNGREVRMEMPRIDAIAFEKERGETYKVELIEDLPEDSIISFYRQGDDFIDLCAGPHLPSVGRIKAFKLTGVAGAYWRGSEKNKMLQRIYGTAFATKEQLDEYLHMLEEAKKRDHRKLGRELDLFDVMEEGPGFPFFFPKGMVLRNLLIDFWREIHRDNGYDEIMTPIILSRDLWERSGHWDHYRENMYITKIDEQDFAIKPMNCPGGMLAYKRRLWSYRDLPLRLGELGLVHRHEKSGTLHGLMRLRCFTQDDAHIFMTPEQIKDEIMGVYRLTDKVYKLFGLSYTVELSTRPENSIGTDEMWDLATKGLQGALDELGVPYVINEGDGAFYGPKIDFHLRDSIGRTWQCGTIQLDMNLPERFDLSYIGPDGEKHRPIMIHRVVYGAIDRFMAILVEHFAGAFPLWLSPVQAKILTITDRADDAAKAFEAKMKAAGLRAECDLRNEKIGFKVREAQMQKIPYMLTLGDREVEEGTVSVRSRTGENLGVMSQDALVDLLCFENKEKALERNWNAPK